LHLTDDRLRDAWRPPWPASRGNAATDVAVPESNRGVPSRNFDVLSAVSAPTGKDAWAVGSSSGVLILHWNGKTWAAMRSVG
jgi:hypothetical protein